MGDVLPPKRQTVVNRLKRRFDLYRNHHNSCLPRYEQTSNGLYEAQRQETLLLKQRFLESKTKKTKNHKSDHHRSTCKESSVDGPKSQSHPKSTKKPVDESPITSQDCPLEDLEKPAKIPRLDKTPSAPPPPEPDLQQQVAIQKYAAEIANQFSTTSTQPTKTAPPDPIPANQTPKIEPLLNQNQTDTKSYSGPVTINGSSDIECKQEKDIVPDLCQYKSQGSNSNGGGGSGGDRLSDTFPSLEFTEDSGDDVLHPDLLKDLIEDVFTNSSDIMKDFDFEDSVGSIKDQEDSAKDIIELVKGPTTSELRPFQNDGLSFANHQQQNGLFEGGSTNNPTVMSAITTSTTSTAPATSYYSHAQRLPSYGSGVGSNLPIPNGLGMDFKLTEPSPAALTLKQMAEQHQNMQQKQQQQQQQQQQIVSSTLNNRSAFNQDAFANHLNPLRQNYLNNNNNSTNANMAQANPEQTPKTPNPASLFNTFSMDSYPGVIPLNTNLNNSSNNSGIFKQEETIAPSEMLLPEDNRPKQRQTKPPAYNVSRPLIHYSDGMVHHHLQPLSGHPNHPVHSMGQGQYLANQDPRFQVGQSQQMHNAQQVQQPKPDLKQQSNMIQPNHNPFTNFAASAQQNSDSNMMQHVSMPQQIHYQTHQFHSNAVLSNRPPPEYKAHQQAMANNENIHMQAFKNNTYMRNVLRPPNVTLAPEGMVPPRTLGDWRHGMMNSQQPTPNRLQTYSHQDNYVGNHQQHQFYPHQYRMPDSHPMSGNLNPQGSHMLLQNRQRMAVQLRPRSDMGSPGNSGVISQMYNNHQTDVSRHQDGSQINLDFLDNIESSASDLLNFDQVMQGNTTHFSLLDDIEILGK